jgi:hypothetical protein
MSEAMLASEAKALSLAGSSIQDIPLENIRESSGNPRRVFDEAQLREFADFVPGNKIRVMFPPGFCAFVRR